MNSETVVASNNVASLTINNAPTFFMNGYGKSITDFGADDGGYTICLQVDGKILVAGYSRSGSNSDFALVRYNTDGSFDESFSGDGKLTTDFGGAVDLCLNLTLQSDGKILAAGASDSRFALARYNTDGTLDTSFSDDGQVKTDIVCVTTAVLSSFYAYMSVAQVDGKILLAGGSNNHDFVLVRFNMDGTLDSTFSDDGQLTTDFENGYDQANSLIVQPDGKILVAGSTSTDVQMLNFALVRYNTDGALDTTFSDDGKLTTDFVVGDCSWSAGESVTLQPDGKILVAGMTYNASAWRYDFALARYNIDGTLDTSFGDDGKVTTSLSQYDKGFSVVVQSDGKILVAGSAQWDAAWGIALVRYNTDGTLDTSFDGDGKVTTSIYDDTWKYAYGADMIVQPDGKILVSGSAIRKTNMDSYNASDIIVVRYNTDGSLDSDFGKINSFDGIHVISLAEGTGVIPSENIELTFNVPVKAGTGSIVLHSGSATGTVVASYDVATSANLTISGNTLIINPTTDLADSTHYFVTLDAGSFYDLAGNPVAASTYDFTTYGPIVEKETLFTDDFTTPLNPADWDYNHWKAVNNPSFYGRTQQRQELPGVSDGELHLKLETFNPTYNPADPKQIPSFVGSEVITRQTFSNNEGGIFFEVKAHFVDPVDGVVGGMFLYTNSIDAGTLHDEIDFEVVSNKPDQIQTNIYSNEPLDSGHSQYNSIEGVVTEDHFYRIEWFQNAIRWFVDGQLVRVETTNIPQQPMALHLNIWAPGSEWIEGFSNALNPVITAGANTSCFFDIDSVRVVQLSSTVVDITPPEVTTFSPVDAATGVIAGSNIVLTFNEAIQKGSGLIAIHSGSATGTVVESYDVATSSNLVVAGNTLTINPSTALACGTHYYVTFGDGNVKDLASNNSVGTSAYDFTMQDSHALAGGVTFWKTGASIAEVTSTLTTVPTFGITSDSMTTSADGRYQHIDMLDGSYALTSDKVSGTAECNAINVNDALAALKMAIGINPNGDGSPVSPYQYLAADVNHDGQVKAADALNILKMAVKLSTAPANEWLFVPESIGSETMSRTHVLWSDNQIPVMLDTDHELDLIGIVKGDVNGSWVA